MASSVLLGSTAPEEQAEPVETAKPARSRRMSSASPSTPGKATCEVFGRRGDAGAVDDRARDRAAQPASKRSRRAARQAPPRRQLLARRRRRRAEADQRRHVLGPGPPPPLLAAADQERRRARRPLRTQSAAAPERAVELVGAERQVVDPERRRRPPASCPPPARRRRAPARRARGRRRATSATGWSVPSSLLASIRQTRRVSGRRARDDRRGGDDAVRARGHARHLAARAAPAAPRPRGSRGARAPRSPGGRAGARRARADVPTRTALLASVPEAVKTTSGGRRAEQRRHLLARLLDRVARRLAEAVDATRDCRTARPARGASPPAPAGRAAWWRCGRGTRGMHGERAIVTRRRRCSGAGLVPAGMSRIRLSSPRRPSMLHARRAGRLLPGARSAVLAPRPLLPLPPPPRPRPPKPHAGKERKAQEEAIAEAAREVPAVARGGRRCSSPTRSATPSWPSRRTTSATPSSSASGRRATPTKATARNEFQDRWEARVEEARSQLRRRSSDDRARDPAAQRPAGRRASSRSCTHLLWPLEVWYYAGSDRCARSSSSSSTSKWGAGPFRIWKPLGRARTLFAGSAGAARGEHSLGAIAQRLPRRRQARRRHRLGAAPGHAATPRSCSSASSDRPTGPRRRVGGHLQAPTRPTCRRAPRTFPAKLDVEFPGRHQNRTVRPGRLTVPVADAGQARSSASTAPTTSCSPARCCRTASSSTASATSSTSRPTAVGAARRPAAGLPALPAAGRLHAGPQARGPQLASSSARSGTLAVPAVDRAAAAAAAAPTPRAPACSPRPTPPSPTARRRSSSCAPPGDLQTGMLRFDTLTTGSDIDQVTFALDGKPVLTKKQPPYSVELDLGIAARARARSPPPPSTPPAAELARDEMLINAGRPPLRGARWSSRSGASATSSSLRAAAEVEVPEGEAVERVEFFLNETLVATLYQPPFAQPILLPKGEPLAYVRAVAYLPTATPPRTWSSSTRPTTSTRWTSSSSSSTPRCSTAQGRPVEGLDAEGLHGHRGRRPAGDRALRAGRPTCRSTPPWPLDVSASMDDEPRAGAAGGAAASSSRRSGPRTGRRVVTFNDRPNLAVKFTNDVTDAGRRPRRASRPSAAPRSTTASSSPSTTSTASRASGRCSLLSDGKDEGEPLHLRGRPGLRPPGRRDDLRHRPRRRRRTSKKLAKPRRGDRRPRLLPARAPPSSPASTPRSSRSCARST